MTYNDFLSLVAREAARYKEMRYGQVWYNILSLHRPDLAHNINGTPLDPFYKDNVPEESHMFVEDRW